MSVQEGRVLTAFPRVPGRYEIERVIGSGATSVVYLGHDTLLQRDVAIKRLNAGSAADAQPDLVLAEARTAAALNHPNICTIFEVVHDDVGPLIVMEYLEGTPLARSIPPDVGLPLETVLSIGTQISDALAHAHDHGIVHRDFKSANVMLVGDRAKVVDFGLSVQVAKPTLETLTLTTENDSVEQGITGTLPYMSPEVLRGQGANRCSDVWSLGVVLYEMACGARPFTGTTSYELSSAILNGTPAPLPETVPASLRAVISKCLTKNLKGRYQSAGEVRAAVEALRLESGRGWQAFRLPQVSTYPLAAFALLAVLLGLVLLGRRLQGPMAEATYLAVIPQVTEGNSVGAESLAEGLAASIIDRVWALHGLKVFPLTTASSYSRVPGDVVEKARRELNAQLVATIRITEQDGQQVVSVALTSTNDKAQIWGRSFQTPPEDILSVGTEIVATITARLCERLAIRDCVGALARQGVDPRPPRNSHAYQFYVVGRHFWYTPTSTAETYRKSLEHYDLAIKADPEYARAYLGIADAVLSLGWEGWIRPDEMQQKADEALGHATILDPGIPEAHYTRATLSLFRRDWRDAEREFEAGIRDAPSFTQLRRFYSLMLLSRGRTEEALRILNEAMLFDPRGLGTNLALGTTLYWSGDLDGAITQIRKTLVLEPRSATSHEILADVYESKGLKDLAAPERLLALEHIPDDETAKSLRQDFARLGYDAGMRRLYESQLKLAAALSLETYVSPMHLAMLHIRLGHNDEAFEWLERAVEERAPWLMYLRMDPAFAPIRNDRRFSPLVARVGIPSS